MYRNFFVVLIKGKCITYTVHIIVTNSLSLRITAIGQRGVTYNKEVHNLKPKKLTNLHSPATCFCIMKKVMTMTMISVEMKFKIKIS